MKHTRRSKKKRIENKPMKNENDAVFSGFGRLFEAEPKFRSIFFLSIFFYTTFFCCVKRRHKSESICWNQWEYLHLHTAAVYNWQNYSNSNGLFALWLCYSHSFPEISFRLTLIIGFQDSKKINCFLDLFVASSQRF